MTDIHPVRPLPGAGLEPERDTRGALSRLVEVLLDKGVYLDLDLIVTVAEVPLIAVDIRAAIAGVETMIEYGLLGPWAGASGSSARPAPSSTGEEAALSADAWYREPRASGSVWRAGTLTIDRSGELRWQGHGDRRAALRVPRDGTTGGRVRPAAGPGDRDVLELAYPGGIAALAGEDVGRWRALLGDLAGHPERAGGGTP